MEYNDLIKFLKSAMNFDEMQIWYLKQQVQGIEPTFDDMLKKFFELKTNEEILELYDYIQPCILEEYYGRLWKTKKNNYMAKKILALYHINKQ